jgi:hypothetical protein
VILDQAERLHFPEIPEIAPAFRFSGCKMLTHAPEIAPAFPA